MIAHGLNGVDRSSHQRYLRQSSSHTPEALSGLMKLEVISLCAHLTNVLEDSREHKRLMILDNSQDAQSILDLIQMVRFLLARHRYVIHIIPQCLELPLDPSIKRLHFRTLVKMSRTYGLYPNCLVLQGIEMNAFVPEAAGAYGDIYKGKFRGKTLALKVLRVYQRSDLHALLKVKSLKNYPRFERLWANFRASLLKLRYGGN